MAKLVLAKIPLRKKQKQKQKRKTRQSRLLNYRKTLVSRSIPLDRWQSQLVSGQCDLFLFFCSGEKRKAFREFSETIRTSIPLFFVTLTVGKRNYCTLEVVNPATTHNVCCKYICWMGTIVGSFDCYFEKSSSFFFFFYFSGNG